MRQTLGRALGFTERLRQDTTRYICRFIGAPACRVFAPDHLISPRLTTCPFFLRESSLLIFSPLRTPTQSRNICIAPVYRRSPGRPCACAVASSHMDANECCRAHPCTRAIGEDFQMGLHMQLQPGPESQSASHLVLRMCKVAPRLHKSTPWPGNEAGEVAIHWRWVVSLIALLIVALPAPHPLGNAVAIWCVRAVCAVHGPDMITCEVDLEAFKTEAEVMCGRQPKSGCPREQMIAVASVERLFQQSPTGGATGAWDAQSTLGSSCERSWSAPC